MLSGGGKKALKKRRFSDIRRNFFESMKVNAVDLAFQHGLVGMRVRVYWPNEKDWFKGRISKFREVPMRGEDGVNQKHRINYDDGAPLPPGSSPLPDALSSTHAGCGGSTLTFTLPGVVAGR